MQSMSERGEARTVNGGRVGQVSKVSHHSFKLWLHWRHSSRSKLHAGVPIRKLIPRLF